jgi:hypothetical protein
VVASQASIGLKFGNMIAPPNKSTRHKVQEGGQQQSSMLSFCINKYPPQEVRFEVYFTYFYKKKNLALAYSKIVDFINPTIESQVVFLINRSSLKY